MQKKMRYLTLFVLMVMMICSCVSGSGIDTLLTGNEQFVAGEFNENKDLFEELLSGQSPHTLVISCSDSRSAPEMIFSSKPGELFVHRNIGNIVAPDDWSLSSVLEYGIRHLKVSNIVVLGHEDCGAVKALAFGGVSEDSFIPGWLSNSYPALTRLSERNPPPESEKGSDQWISELAKENIRLQLDHLKTNPVVRDGITSGGLKVYGMFWNMSSGKAEEIT